MSAPRLKRFVKTQVKNDGSSLFAQIEEEREREGLESKEARRGHAEREQKIQV